MNPSTLGGILFLFGLATLIVILNRPEEIDCSEEEEESKRTLSMGSLPPARNLGRKVYEHDIKFETPGAFGQACKKKPRPFYQHSATAIKNGDVKCACGVTTWSFERHLEKVKSMRESLQKVVYNLENNDTTSNTEDSPMTKSKTYTEHEAEIKYTDGETEDITFDKLSWKDDRVVFSNYTGFKSSGRFQKEKFCSVMTHNLRRLLTTKRTKKKMKRVNKTETEVVDVDE